MIVRWDQPSGALTIEAEHNGRRRTDRIRLDAGGVLRVVRDDHGDGYWRDAVATVSGDSSILIVLSASVIEQWRILPDGNLEIEAGRQSSSRGYRAQSRRYFRDARLASQAARDRLARFGTRLSGESASAIGTLATRSRLGAEAEGLPQSAPIAAQVGRPSERVALVIGVSVYGTLGDLDNPANDARAVAASLQRVGFHVELLINPDQRSMRQAVSRLGERMSAAGPGGTGLFFFAGHGVQARGINYLIPSAAPIVREADLALEAIPADSVLMQMQDAGVSTNILILDACRNMPLTRSLRNGERGLAQMEAPNGSFIAYSTAPGSVAQDGDAENSPFAAALIVEIPRRGQPLEAVFRNVRRAVLHATGGAQLPWDSSSMLDPFYFVPN